LECKCSDFVIYERAISGEFTIFASINHMNERDRFDFF